MSNGNNVRNATMADVARLAQVSVPTVSRVLSGAARVRPDKQARVEAAIQRLGFRPSAAARALASGRSEVIAVITGSTSNYGYAEAIRGVEEAARADGYTVIITVVESFDDDVVSAAVENVLNQSIAGVVVLKFDRAGVAALRHLPSDLPLVALSGVRDTGVPQAVIDETRGAEELTEYLLSLGHETVHHVRVPPSRREDGRTTGWKRALRKAGAPIPLPLDATWEPRSGRVVGRDLARNPDVTAVFCGNDEIAMGVIKGITDQGLAVPKDISVVGFDDHPLAELWTPALTTVRQDFADLGRRGFGLLKPILDKQAASQFSSVHPEMIIRSSAAVRTDSQRRKSTEGSGDASGAMSA
ncbi:LacI family DNA-binding transcriptional regulator [Humibacter sp. RRB41]|uniref:LacI family DNA-binding transcriptional regulator n=1 Tax=Humibacter sp. RRB41 TaxID=2919946 RepID=UPI001FA94BDE|nr:LacI family DNA-binding transcriptional regulator [Humibacter sp. RRB41]